MEIQRVDQLPEATSVIQNDLDAVFREVCGEEFEWARSDLGLELVSSEFSHGLIFGDNRIQLIVGRVVRVSEPSRKIDARIRDLELDAGEQLPPIFGEASFGIGQIAKLRLPEMSDLNHRTRYSGKNYYADTSDQIASAARQVSLDWSELITRELIRSDEFWNGLISVAITNRMNLTSDRAREEAIEAFEARNFALAIELYERVPGALTGADKKRIEISKRHVSE